MTENEWLDCTDPMLMVRFLERKSTSWIVRLFYWLNGGGYRPNRKLLLAYCAFCRTYWDLVTWEKRQRAVEVVERVVDEKPITEFSEDAQWTVDTAHTVVLGVLNESAQRRTLFWDKDSGTAARAALEEGNKCFCNLLRDIFANPFCPATIDQSWLTPNVVALARNIYDDRSFDRMPELADALEEAGCDSEDMLSHCRELGEHVRGCWVVDLLLGKK